MKTIVTKKKKEEELIQQVKEWHKLAKHDIEKAEDDLNRGWYSDSCFYSQQACEKILKAFLRSRGVIMRGHKIEELIMVSKEHGLEVEDLIERREMLEELSDQYLAPRYPNFRGKTARKIEDYTEDFAKSCLGVVRKIWERVRKKLKQTLEKANWEST
ncbi:MAG: HEPN domain protein [Candidatus Bathyarchaeota archaeon BA1]|nr:MAG: HEPN domain protein [Candidatus Bathyarchaeota archaeon BA1]